MKNLKNFWLIILLIACILIGIYLIFNSNKDKKDTIPDISVRQKCNFELLDVKVSRYHKDGPDLNRVKGLEEELESVCTYNGVGINFCEMSESRIERELNWEKDSKDKLTWIEVEGVIKLNGNKDQSLKDIISRIYTNDDKKIFLGEAHSSINKVLNPGTSYPFKMSVELNRNIELIGKYFQKDDEVRIDTYPYFLSCNY